MKVLQKWAKRACRSRAINIIDNYFPRDLLTDRETVYQEVSRCSPEKQGKENMLFDGRILFPRAKLLSWGLVIVGLDSIAFLCPQGHGSKVCQKTPTYPRKEQTSTTLCMKEMCSYLEFGVPGVCSRNLLEFSWRKVLLFVCSRKKLVFQ